MQLPAAISLLMGVMTVIYTGWIATSCPALALYRWTIDAPVQHIINNVTDHVERVSVPSPTVTITTTVDLVTPSSFTYTDDETPRAETNPHPQELQPIWSSFSHPPDAIPSSTLATAQSLGIWLTEPKLSVLHILIIFSTLAMQGVGLFWFLSLFARDTRTRSCTRRFFSRAYLSSWFPTPLSLPPFPLSIDTLGIQTWIIIHEILLFGKKTSRYMLSGVLHLVLLGLNTIMEFALLCLSKRARDLPSRMENVVDLIIAADDQSYKVVLEMVRQISTWLRFALRAAFHQRVLRLEKSEIMQTGEYKQAEEDYQFAFTCTYQEILLLRRDNRAAEHELDLVKAKFERYKAENPVGMVQELGKKAVSPRRPHVEPLPDQNFWKTQRVSQCNWRHNVVNGVTAKQSILSRRSILRPDYSMPAMSTGCTTRAGQNWPNRLT